MSTSYQTSAKPRGRRDTEATDRSSRSRAPSETSQILTKKISRSSDEPLKSSRPSSPALFLQRSRGMDQRLSIIDPVSPKSSSASMKAERQIPSSEADGPTVTPSSKAAPKSTPLNKVTNSSQSESQTTRISAQTSVSSRPATPIAKTAEVLAQSKTPIVAPFVPASVVGLATPLSPQPQASPATTGSIAALQPLVEDFLDESTPIATPARSSPPKRTVSPKSAPVIHQHSKTEAFPPFLTQELPTNQSREQPATQPTHRLSRCATPVVSPPQSPQLTHYAGYPGQTPMAYSYYPQHMIQQPPAMYGAPYYAAPFSPSPEHSLLSEGRSSRSASDDEHHRLMEKVSSVLPDINRLLDQYRETHGQLSAKDMLVKQSESEHADQINRLKLELDANKTEYEKVINDVVSENGQLKREAEQLREKISGLEKMAEEHVGIKAEMEKLQSAYNELTANFDAVGLSKEQILADKVAQDSHIDSLKKQHQAEMEKHHLSISELRHQLAQQTIAANESQAKALNAKDEVHLKALAEKDENHAKYVEGQEEIHKQVLAENEQNHTKLLSDHKTNLSKVQMELANLITKHTNQKKDLEAIRLSEVEHREKYGAKSKDFEHAVGRHAQEIEAIRIASAEEHQRAVNESVEHSLKVVQDHSTKEKEWVQIMDALRKEMQTQKDEIANERALHESYKKDQDERSKKHAELTVSILNWKSKHSELQKENENMERIMQGLGHAAEMKSKGDEFFKTTFRQLATLISDLSRDRFVHVPRILPRDILFLIPTGIPDFMGNSDCASLLRSLYVQHKVWEVLDIRIFQPFLFTLVQKYGGVDTFLLSLSSDIRRKSERREATWRQTTLRAAYTDSHAKQAINLAAAMTVDEILTEVKHFAVPREWPALTTAVQVIVKSAAEIWRYARVEREMITASMPDTTDADMNEWFEAPEHHHTDIQSAAVTKPSETAILRVVPHVVREPGHAGFVTIKTPANTAPCVYLQGLALFSDSPIVLQRRWELHGNSPGIRSPVRLSPNRHNGQSTQKGIFNSPASRRIWKSMSVS